MKLLRYTKGGKAALGVLRDDRVVSLTSLAAEYPTMLALIAGGDAALNRVRDAAHGAETRWRCRTSGCSRRLKGRASSWLSV